MDTVRFFKDHARAQQRAARDEETGHATLQQVQHQVAVAAGYRSWSDLLHADEDDRELAATMTREPDLNYNGFGPGPYRGTREERVRRFNDWRAELRVSSRNVAEVRGWLLDNVAPRATLSRDTGSYGMKHLAERSLGDYVSNGVLIAAAIGAGYTYRREPGLSPNALFAWSERSVNAIRRQVS